MQLNFSIIIPVYNRPKEVKELLQSIVAQQFAGTFEVVIVEDGSKNTCKDIVTAFAKQLDLAYHYKPNTGAGDSRNFGMQHAKGNYFIILDSDVLLPKHYLIEVQQTLTKNFTDAFGGPDAADASFTPLQKGITYAMTAFLTTGGIRGKKNSVGKFQPRSFNFGLSKKAFHTTLGFSKMPVGEDIDLTFRLWQNGFNTQLITTAFVYHKRRTTLKQFYNQTFSFGTARPVLNKKYPDTKKITYWFPSLFLLGAFLALGLSFIGLYYLLICYVSYLIFVFIDALYQYKNIKVAFLSVIASITQFFGYGLGFLSSQLKTN